MSDLKRRTTEFALDILKFVEALPRDEGSRVLGRSTAARWHVRRGKLPRRLPRKIECGFHQQDGTVEEEADESGYWLELLVESGRIPQSAADPLLREADELVAISVSSIQTARKNSPHSALRTPHSALK